jgi:RNA polymerase sigma factor (sigma-70 family)
VGPDSSSLERQLQDRIEALQLEVRETIRRFNDWLSASAAKVGFDSASLEDTARLAFLHRICGCWEYHWGQVARQSFDEVARALRGAQDPRSGNSLGGDPLHEVVLAEAILRGLGHATEQFEAEYQPQLFRVVRSVLNVPSPEQDWWEYLLSRCHGTPEAPGLLAKFAGRCALAPYLRTAVTNLLRTLIREPRPGRAIAGFDLPDLADPTPGPSAVLSIQDCRGKLAGLLSEGLARLGESEVRILTMRYEQRLPARSVAELLGLKTESVDQTASRAVRKLKAGWQDRAEEIDWLPECLAELESTHEMVGLFAEASRRFQQRRAFS